MALDPNRWTLKTQEAFNAAVEAARSAENPEVVPDHLLAALLGQEDGIVLPLLNKVDASPLTLRNATDERLAKLPNAYGGGEARMSRALTAAMEQADREREQLTDEYLSTEHVLLAMADTIGVGGTTCWPLCRRCGAAIG